MLALSLGFASCEEKWIEAEPQNNPQDPTFTVEGVTVANALPEAIDLKAIAEDNDTIKSLQITSVKDQPANSSLEFAMEMSATEDFAAPVAVKAEVVGDMVCSSAKEWQDAYYSTISHSPKAKDVYVRYALYVKKGTNSVVRLGGLDKYIGQSKVSVTPFPSENKIENAYYLLGTINGWSVAEAVKFNHSDKDVYDDPVFTIKVDISKEQAAEGWWWKIVPQSTYETGNWVDAAYASFGVAENGDIATEGMLVARTATEDCGAGCLKTDGQLLLTINLEEGTYSFTSAIDFLYTPGDSNGWNHDNSQKLGTNNYADYSGYAYLKQGSFKFTSAPDWDHVNYGAGAEAGTLSTDGGAGNISVAADGLYYCKVNIASLTYELVQVNTIGVIGNATPGEWASSTALEPTDETKLKWTGDIVFKGGEFKFRANDGWDINLGGALDNLVQDGDNMATPGEGTYTVTLDLSAIPYKATIVKK